MAGLISQRVSALRLMAVAAVAEGMAAPTWPGGLVSRTAPPAG